MSADTTCQRCRHFDSVSSRIPGFGHCQQEPLLYRRARTFSPSMPCNKNQFQPIPGDRRKQHP